MLTPRQPDPAFFLAFKNGSLAASHTHLDLNHVSLGIGGTMLLVDLGSRPYPADYFSPARLGYYEITTAGHNTVLVGGKGQSPGKHGVLKGPFEGPQYTAFTGVADGAYQVPAPRAQRTVVFVDRRYFVLLDDVQAEAGQQIELSFHTYGAVTPRADGGWVVTADNHAVDVVPASLSAVSGRTEAPTGWIKPVTALRLTAQEATGRLLIATALIPRPAGVGPHPRVTQETKGQELLVSVGGDRITFRETADGFVVSGVSVAGRR